MRKFQLCARHVAPRVVGQFNRQPRIVILSTFASLSVDSAKDLGPHSLYSEILRLRLRMTRW